MKNFLIFLAAVIVGSTTANATVFSSTDTPQTILDGNITGIESTINVTGGNIVSGLVLTLNISGGRNGDLYAYLTHDGVTAVLLNRVGRGDVAGGYSDTGFAITFSGVGSDIHTYQTSSPIYDEFGRLTGIWGADGRDVSPFVATTLSTRSSNALGAFNGYSGDGDWTLFLADVNGNSLESTLDSWSITEVPEPTTWALIGFGVIFSATNLARWWFQRGGRGQKANLFR
jgi:subtilisin-like proprotein convertase family protein